MSAYPAHIEELRLEALRTKCADWAMRSRWKLTSGLEMVGPCAVCGGTDRFAINRGSNKWLCRVCDTGGGDVISLVMHTAGLDFKKALEHITGRKIDPNRVETLQEKQHREKRLADAQAQAERDKTKANKSAAGFRHRAKVAGKIIWAAATPMVFEPGQPVFDYLSARGINMAAILQSTQGQLSSLRQVAGLDYFERDQHSKSRRIYFGPAMVAGVQTATGFFGAVHQTWIDQQNAPGFKANLLSPWQIDKQDAPLALPSKKVLGSKKGGAIRLYTPANPKRLVAGEGIETTLTVMANAFESDTAYWCLVDLGNMGGRAARDGEGKTQPDMPDMTDTDTFVPPGWVEELVYLGDADAKTESQYAKTQAALTRGCRRAMALRPGLEARISMADRGTDFNDMVRSEWVDS